MAMSHESVAQLGPLHGYVGLDQLARPILKNGLIQQLEEQLRGRPPQVAIGDLAYERDNVGIAPFTRSIALRISQGEMEQNEALVAYNAFMFARHVATRLLGRPPELDVDLMTEQYSGLSGRDIKAANDAYLRRRLGLKALHYKFIEKLDRQGRRLDSAGIVMGLVFSEIDSAEAKRAEIECADAFGALLADDEKFEEARIKWFRFSLDPPEEQK
jgi:hypothetical protein